MKALLLLLLLVSSAGAGAQPNVIYILADDLGYGDLSCYGQQKFKTPHIDRLATEGLRFTHHYSGNTVCSPSRAVLMTGMDSGHCYVRGNADENRVSALPGDLTVLPEVFKAAGYRTGAFGKWGLGITTAPGAPNPLSHGFDEFCGWKSQTIAHTYYPSSYVRNGREIPLDGKTYLHPLVLREARAFIAASVKAGEPFFCYLATPIPHAAMHAPADLHDKWRKVFPEFDDRIGCYGAGPGEKCPDVVNPIAGFAAMMEHLDQEIGALLDLLRELGIDHNTLVLFASDNGAHLEGGHDPAFWNSTGGLRGHKRDMHEGGIRTPMLARWPGKIRPGTTTRLLSGFQDVVPTMAELIGQPVPAQSDGLSFLPTLLGNADQQKTHAYLYFEFRTGNEQTLVSQALRFGDWKVFQPAPGALELYNLARDPFEQSDLARRPESAEVVAQARALLAKASVPLPHP
jgi:arylsulfatase A-like enzyme